ncbi:hypothetical protein M8C21_032974 [Ambrosia artemisiifolia]|uniref:Receptor-like protein 12 n=1 Tax=Ambrosia artemisiifolia TaxID=4212 RepID=A0AAD5BRT0_AMBAR|nr:hypothetical protein M8C21_032974 [Ambrosia artemisiifolia]
MSNSIMLFFLLSLFFISSTSSSSIKTIPKCSVQQTHALLLLNKTFPLSMINWDSRCEDWLGTIHPNTTLFYLPHLRRLNLAFNFFTNFQLPHDIGRVSNSLTHLNISCCGYTGQIPTDISHLHKLVSLDLSFNQNGFDYLKLEPHVFINLLQNSTVMEQLSLENVNISLLLPTNLNISSSSSLKLLNLRYTRLQGNLPHNIFNLQSLETLDFLTAHIPSEISLLLKLVSPDLSVNGNEIDTLLIQPHIFRILLTNSTILRDLRLDEVNIGFLLLTYLNISSALRSLGLSYTNLQGKLPHNIFNLEYLEELYLSGNSNLSGPFPKVNTTSTIPLRQLYLSKTSLSGEIRTSIGYLKSLEYLDLSYCGFNGSLPKPLGTLSLANNQLTGQIDVLDNGPGLQTFQRLTNLNDLDLSYNNFRGDWELDALLSSLTILESLVLSYSGISVTTSNGIHYVNPHLWILSLASCSLKVFPVSIRAMKNLQHLDLSNNDIQGHIPDWIGEIGRNQLFALNIANNSGVYFERKSVRRKSAHFFEQMSKIDSSCPQMKQFSWCHCNFFQGQLPTNYFQNFNVMKNVLRDNTKPNYVEMGSICERSRSIFSKLLVNYTIVDLSDNKFHGEIPNITGYLKCLKVLNLSHNSLTGRIPHALGLISEIESLDLSWNQLIGEIPQSLADLTFLEFLNLSQNHLMGRIPQGRQFNTFDGYSYSGNPKLHGLLLPSKCSEHLPKPQPKGDEDGQQENGFTWKVVVMGYGCGALLGIVMGYLMLSTEKPKWFNAIFDDVEHFILKRQNKRR